MKKEVVDDIKRVAQNIGLKPGEEFTHPKYFENGGRYTEYQIADGGFGWKKYCESAGFKPKVKEQVSREECWERYQRALEAIRAREGKGRHPKSNELKRSLVKK